MSPTSRVLPSDAHVTPCDQWPIDASATRASVLPVTRTMTTLPPSCGGDAAADDGSVEYGAGRHGPRV
jgi:hypothetical protein